MHADDGAFGNVGVRRQHFFHLPVDRRWPATLITSSVRVMIQK